MTPAGLPHSEIPGSKRVCRSPRLIAACRVLHRRSAPRHPPFTLSSLAIKYLRREFTNLVHSFAFFFASCSILLSKTFRAGTRPAPKQRFLRLRRRFPPPSGADRDRTDDLRLAKPPLSQLSYSPVRSKSMVGLDRFELSTPRLSSVCSNQLSYRPIRPYRPFRPPPRGSYVEKSFRFPES